MYLADLAQLCGLPATATETEVLAAVRVRREAAAAPPAGSRPWGASDPVAWAEATERITASSAGFWRSRHREDPAGVEATLAQLVPVPASLFVSVPLVDPIEETYAAMFGPVDHRVRPSAATYAQPAVIAGPAPTTYPNAVEELRATHPQLVAAAERGDPAPTMFSTGDYPTTTASGLNPTALRGLPWRARLAAAWEPSLAEAHRMVEAYAGGDQWEAHSLDGNAAVRDYVARVQAWAATSGVNAE